MKTKDFFFDLPDNLIAQFPSSERGQSRLLVMNRETRRLEHRMVMDLPSIIDSNTLMVFNNSRVRRSRIFGVPYKNKDLKDEFLLLRKIDDRSWYVLTRKSKRRKNGDRFLFDDVAAVIEICEGQITLCFDRPIDDAWLDLHGHVPLPPYIKREDTLLDGERYQTIFANEYGSAAAPTAGLHFTPELLLELKKVGIEIVFITLHVGLGTFLPVREQNIEDHQMHEETYFLGCKEASLIEKAKNEGRKILAVGTTSLRTLESAWIENTPSQGFMPGTGSGSAPGREIRRGEGSTSIFIYPGYKFKLVDSLFTNFHTPESTLLMLVSAFASLDNEPDSGRNFILKSYKEAINHGYRFFSYGDACLIL